MRTRGLLPIAPLILSLLVTGCGSATDHARQAAADRQHSLAERTAFLRTCNRGVGAGALGDAAVCQCTLSQLETETTSSSFKAAVAAWESNADGAAYRSTVAQTIARCRGQQQVSPAPQSASAVVPSDLPAARTVRISSSAFAKQYRWPTSARSMVHSCLDGTAVANGMNCALSQAIDHAFGEYPDRQIPLVRHLHLVNPVNGQVISVDCAVSGRREASAVCNAPDHQVALLPPPDYSD
jgi:hypothetical protein